MKEKLFGFWDYEGAELRRKFLGISLVRKASVHTLLAFGIPLMQRKRHVTKDIYKTGGGGILLTTHLDSAGSYATRSQNTKN
ncbi:hypothetical protein [Helicobacter sp.]|uniref:hypothetical protein n=1 Tax=Helicobacter sp. TaxID=218 RepID=UPI003890700E